MVRKLFSHLNCAAVKAVVIRILLGQLLAFLNSLTGVSTTKLVDNNASYPLLQSVTSYLFIFLVYGPAFLYCLWRFRQERFSNFSFLHRWWKYAILAVVDLEANFCIVYAYQFTDMMSVQLLNCFTIPCVLVLSFFILRMRFALTHILGCIVALGGVAFLIALDADGMARSGAGSKPVLGDMLCLIASALYATSNVLTEWFVKPKQKTKRLVEAAPEEEEAPAEPAATENPAKASEDVASATLDRDADQENPTRDFNEEDERRPVPVYVPVVENLAMMSMFAGVFATIQFFAVEWRTFKPHRSEWSGTDWLFQVIFGLTMLCVYTGMPALFILTSAAFVNISLLTANIYSIIWNVTIFKIYPTKLFIVSFIIIVIGIVVFNLTDLVRIPYRWNYPCGPLTRQQSNEDDTATSAELREQQLEENNALSETSPRAGEPATSITEVEPARETEHAVSEPATARE